MSLTRRVNLVPAPPLSLVMARASSVLSAVLLVLLCIYLGARFIVLQGQEKRLLKENARLVSEVHKVKALDAEIGVMRQRLKGLKEEKARLLTECMRLQERRRDVPDFYGILVHVAESLPDFIRLTSIDLEREGGEIKGEARDVKAIPRFIEGLKREGPIRAVELKEIVKAKDQGMTVFRFRIVFTSNYGGKA